MKPFSYYDATLALIRERMDSTGISLAEVAAALRVTEAEMTGKLTGTVLLLPAEIAELARVFDCPMSEIVA